MWVRDSSASRNEYVLWSAAVYVAFWCRVSDTLVLLLLTVEEDELKKEKIN